MDIEARRHLRLLEAVEEDSRVTQRGLAVKLGIALGLTNIYLKRLVRKGYIKCVNVQSNRLSYLITPRGIAEKARLTYEFIDYSLHLYSEVRHHLRGMLHECAVSGSRVAIYGRGEAAEIAYLSLKEFRLEPIAIFDEQGGYDFAPLDHLGEQPAAQEPVLPDELLRGAAVGGGAVSGRYRDGRRHRLRLWHGAVGAAPAQLRAAADWRRPVGTITRRTPDPVCGRCGDDLSDGVDRR